MTIPGLRAIVQHSWRTVLIGKAIPVVLFLAAFAWVGVSAAIAVSLAWSLGVVAYQRRTGQRVAGLVLLSVIGNTAKSVAALLTGSVFLYFVQPTISTTLIGLAFLVSVPMGKPLAERLIQDFCPFDEATANHPVLSRFFSQVSLVWAATSLLNGAITLHLLLTQSITTFVLIKSVLGPATTGLTILVGVAIFRRRMAHAGVEVVIARRVAPTPTSPSPVIATPAVVTSATAPPVAATPALPRPMPAPAPLLIAA